MELQRRRRLQKRIFQQFGPCVCVRANTSAPMRRRRRRGDSRSLGSVKLGSILLHTTHTLLYSPQLPHRDVAKNAADAASRNQFSPKSRSQNALRSGGGILVALTHTCVRVSVYQSSSSSSQHTQHSAEYTNTHENRAAATSSRISMSRSLFRFQCQMGTCQNNSQRDMCVCSQLVYATHAAAVSVRPPSIEYEILLLLLPLPISA